MAPIVSDPHAHAVVGLPPTHHHSGTIPTAMSDMVRQAAAMTNATLRGTHWGRASMILMRLHGRIPVQGDYGMPDNLVTLECPDYIVVLARTADGKHVVLEDPKDLFPSDTLITQLRLIGIS